MLAAMIVQPKWSAVVCVLIAAGVAVASPPPGEKPVQSSNVGSAAPSAASQTPAERKALMRQFRDEREKRVHERGDIFARIAIKHDYTGEYVLYRDQDVTAFLDLKDPQHPRYKPRHGEGGTAATSRLAHILVVPNQPRETIGKTLASDITSDDLELTLKVMREAATLATKFGIQNPKIYVKSPERVGIGYLHVHVVGDRDPKVPYPPPLK